MEHADLDHDPATIIRILTYIYIYTFLSARRGRARSDLIYGYMHICARCAAAPRRG